MYRQFLELQLHKEGSHGLRCDGRAAGKVCKAFLAYFTRPTRSINHRAIGEIRTGAVSR
jgi:hypothetical protein